MSHRFPPLKPQEPILVHRRGLSRNLPQISLPWMELGMALAMVLLMHFA